MFICPTNTTDRENQNNTWVDDIACSYCGSLHPDKFMDLLDDWGTVVEPTNKDYKVYISSPTMPVARLFYFEHLSKEQQAKFVEMFYNRVFKIGKPHYFEVLPFFMKRKDSNVRPT